MRDLELETWGYQSFGLPFILSLNPRLQFWVLYGNLLELLWLDKVHDQFRPMNCE